ncbi:pyridoxal phosphate-dependent aminotransferase [Burkholderia sp. Bp9143]|uniref:pyridoxal phosphate-dependent aminotransferase n=1 Tax=Burkholderia sp. Bp9143 TaxID=2184574 RepID=UPI000F5A8490|nr:pyridoxal phosphate-dependent aminotransferase [Burkholderia sp. Bp9143]RQR22311.1 pyridoxal phosphate-dependent aminotransferase [Burkholderia sp. Bp9143]
MNIIADRIGQIAPAETMAMAARAAELRRAGRNVISLSQGEPDFATPENIQEAAIRAMRSGKTRYTEAAGIPELREAIAAKLANDNGLIYPVAGISVSSGAKQAIFAAFFASLNVGDEVIVPTPCWVSYPEIVKMSGGTPVCVPCPETAGFKLTAAQLEAAITPRTKWLMLNSPSNPTGAVYSRDELMSLANVLRRHPHVWVLSDDIYEKLIYIDIPFSNILNVAPDLYERTLLINGVSKVYAMTGWRIGYAAGPTQLIKAMNLVQGQIVTSATSIAQYASVEALTGSQAFVDTSLRAFNQRRKQVVEALRRIPGLQCREPEGAFYAFVGCQELIGRHTLSGARIDSDQDFVRYLLDDANVAVVSGTGFLLSPYFRLSYAASVEQLEEALQRIEAACAKLLA